MASQALIELRTIALHPPPHGCVVRFQTTFLEQLFHIAQRKRIPKKPADRTKDQLRLGLPPLEDRRPGRHLGIFNLATLLRTKVATLPSKESTLLFATR
jgi:hypothetical protein